MNENVESYSQWNLVYLIISYDFRCSLFHITSIHFCRFRSSNSMPPPSVPSNTSRRANSSQRQSNSSNSQRQSQNQPGFLGRNQKRKRGGKTSSHNASSGYHSQTSRSSTEVSSGNNQTCNCGAPAVELTVRKEGNNQGRKFFSCPNNKACNFFQWADDSQGSNNNRSSYNK